MLQTTALYGPTLRLVPFNFAGRIIRFAIYWREYNLLVGILLITLPEQNAVDGVVELLIADPSRREYFGPEALQIALQFAFSEQDLHRATVCVPEYDTITMKLVETAGFIFETRRRQAIFMRGRFWDELQYGMLVSDWQAQMSWIPEQSRIQNES